MGEVFRDYEYEIIDMWSRYGGRPSELQQLRK